VLGAVAQLERALIAERTKAGLQSARRHGRVGGNPGLRARDPAAIRKMRASRDKAHFDSVLAQLDSWLPTVRRMRPGQPWGDVVRVLNRGQAGQWSIERLRSTVRRLVSAKASSNPTCLAGHGRSGATTGWGRSGPHAAADRVPTRGHARADAPRRHALAPSSVKHLLERAERLGLTRSAAS
jgi:hypothetical protein